jgi:hypothetical protein
MAEEKVTPPNRVAEERARWRTWLEFTQLCGVLLIALATVLPFCGIGWLVWIASPAAVIAGGVFAWISLRLIPANEPQERYEVTPTRLTTLRATGTPDDIVGSLMVLCDAGEKRWNGTAQEFRDTFYSLVGRKRGRDHVQRVLPYLEVYTPKRASDRRDADSSASGRIPIRDQTLQ